MEGAFKRGRGLFISFEGPEGSGKTTQMRILSERLRRLGFSVTESQEPGATFIGKQIRRILLDPENQEMAPLTELLLMFASRAQAAKELIRPALERGDIVISDRFTDSTLAYQGEARGLGFETVLAGHQLAVGDLLPDLTICVTIGIEKGLARAHDRNQGHSEARLDKQPIDFHKSVGRGYEKIGKFWPERVRIVDGEGEIATVAERIWAHVSPLLGRVEV